jgi:Nif-specific regulatory protein
VNPAAQPHEASRPPIRREVKELSLLFEISQTLDGTIDIRAAVHPVLDAMARHMGMLRGTLTLLNRGTGELYIEAAHGLTASQRKRGIYRRGEGVTGKVVETGRAAIVPRISQEPLFLNRTGARSRLQKQDISFICVPIKLGNETIGALSADRLFSEAVTCDEDVRLLSIIASMIAQAVRLRQAALEEQQRLLEENQRLQEELKDRFRPSNIIGNSSAMQAVYDLIANVAKSDTTVLIRGESGVGKELVAHAIHYNSRRAAKAFIKVNCAALPETLIESELFGHEKGAFTGAIYQRKGRFELAAGGTIFLDEVGDFSPSTQIKLLRVLQEKEFERVGGTGTIKTDVRIIAATNRDVENLIAEGNFRQDLYYRLNVFTIHVPPLRDRKTDLPLLVDFFVEKYSRLNHKGIQRISTPAIDMLMSYHWPGNVRELENVIERSLVMAQGTSLDASDIKLESAPRIKPRDETHFIPEGMTLDAYEQDIIREALRRADGNKSQAARLLGLTRNALRYRLTQMGLES